MTMTKLDRDVLGHAITVLRREQEYDLAERIRIFLWHAAAKP